jgi:hypothetical protein
MYVTNCRVGGGVGGIVIPMPEALSFAESRRQKGHGLPILKW